MTLTTFSHTIEAVVKMFQHRSSVIRQKGESQNGENKKTKHAEFFQKRAFLKCSFSRKFGLLCFVVVSVLRFAHLSYYR